MNKLFEIQKRLEPIKKDKENPFHKNWYFDINKILEILKPIFEEMDILLEQTPVIIDGKNALRTTITDVEAVPGGKFEPVVLAESTMFLPTTDNPQNIGSALTYYRRYMLVGIFAMEAEDDDGNKASNPVQQVTKHVGDNSKLPEVVTGGGTGQDTLCGECGNVMVYKTGEKNGKTWRGMFCPTKGHAPIWLK